MYERVSGGGDGNKKEKARRGGRKKLSVFFFFLFHFSCGRTSVGTSLKCCAVSAPLPLPSHGGVTPLPLPPAPNDPRVCRALVVMAGMSSSSSPARALLRDGGFGKPESFFFSSRPFFFFFFFFLVHDSTIYNSPQSQLTMFTIDQFSIKARISDLIDQEYLERSEDDVNELNYLA